MTSWRPGCDTARWPYERPASVADAVAAELAADRIVAWFQGRSEFGPRALGSRSLLAHPGREGQPGPAQRGEGPGGVPAGRPHGADRPGGRDLPTARCPARTCCSCTGRGPGLAGPHPGGGARGRHRPGADRGPRRAAAAGRDARPLRRPHRAAGGREHQPEHGRAARWWTTRGTRWNASAPRRWTCWPSGRSWSAGRPAARRPRPGSALVRVLVVRPDGMGDVLLTGPAVRAIAASGAGGDVPGRAARGRRRRAAARGDTGCWSGGRRGSIRSRAAFDPDAGAVAGRAVRAARPRTAVDLHLLPPVAAADGAGLADGGRAADRRDQRGLPGLTARRPAPLDRGHTGGRAQPRRWPGRPGSGCPPGDTGRLAVTGRAAGQPAS